MLRSLRAKVTLLVLLLGAPFLFAAFQSVATISEQRQLQEKKSIVKRSMTRMGRELNGSNPRGAIEGLYELYGLRDLGVEATLVDRDGDALWQSSDRAPAGRDDKGVQSQMLDKGALLYFQPESAPQKGFPISLALTGAVLVIYGIGGWFLVGRTLKPIAKVVDRVETVSAHGGELSPPSSDREIVDLVDTLNALIGKIETESAERIKTYAMLSHELRTPIQALLGEVDLALGEERTKEELESSLLDVQRQVLRLNAVSEAVLFLQGLSQSQAPAGEEVALDGIVAAQLQALGPLAELRQIDVDARLGIAPIRAPREHLEILTRNLLENALKHSPTGGRVAVLVSPESVPRLEIRNQIDSAPRLDGNRLGLLICRALCDSHGWRLEAGPREGHFEARVEFPLS